MFFLPPTLPNPPQPSPNPTNSSNTYDVIFMSTYRPVDPNPLAPRQVVPSSSNESTRITLNMCNDG